MFVATVALARLAKGWDVVAPHLDSTTRRELLEREREAYPRRGRPEVVTADVRGSWDRCARSVPESALAPLVSADPAAAWRESPLRQASGEAIAHLAELAQREDYVAAITDAAGTILWSSAGRDMRVRAERANFVDGSDWSEGVAGTNAPGLTLSTGRAASVFASEHWCSSVHDWVCYSAPVRDAAGRIAGVVDLSAHWKRASPIAMTTVTALARLVEVQLHAATPPAELRLRTLGGEGLWLRGEPVHVSHRQLEILTVLAMRDGLDRAALEHLVYGDRAVSATTLKAEISHLRSLLGGLIDSRPYRLEVEVELDVDLVHRALLTGDVEGALRAYGGPFLSFSESPFLVEERHHLDVALRRELLRVGTPEQLLAFAAIHPHDRALVERAVVLAPLDSPLHSEAAARLATD